MNGHRQELAQDMEISARHRSNRKGEPFTFEEARRIMIQGYRDDLPADHDDFLSFPEYLQLKFTGRTFILGALRTVQFSRFNAGGVRACSLNTEHYVDGQWRPLVMAKYTQAKRRNAVNPTTPDSISQLSIICTCRGGGHRPLIITWKTDGTPREVIGDIECWYNLFQFCRGGQGPQSTSNIMRIWNKRERQFGKKSWSADRVQKSIAKWARYCGVGRSANNTWARQTYRTYVFSPGLKKFSQLF